MTESTILPDSITAAKSDQLNATDFSTSRNEATTKKITQIAIKGGDDQPLWVILDGDKKKPWKPAKGQTRIMRDAWSRDTALWVGQSVALYNDPHAKWGGVEVGGIRIHAMTGIKEDTTFAVTLTKGKREPQRVLHLVTADAPAPAAKTKAAPDPAAKAAAAQKAAGAIIAAIFGAVDAEAFAGVMKQHADTIERLKAYPDVAATIDAAITARNEANKE